MNWKNAQRNRVVEANTYHVQVAGFRTTKFTTGNDGAIFDYIIIGPEGNEEVGAKISDFFTFTKNAEWRIGWFVSTCGIMTTDLPDMEYGSEDFGRILNLCKGRKLFVTVIKEDYQGSMRNKVTDYQPDDSMEPIEEIQEVPEFIKKKASFPTNKMRRPSQEG